MMNNKLFTQRANDLDIEAAFSKQEKKKTDEVI